MDMGRFDVIVCIIWLCCFANFDLILTSYCQLSISGVDGSIVTADASANPQLHSRKWKKIGKEDHIHTPSGTVVIKARSKLDCLRHCVQAEDCKAFTFNNNQKNCKSFSKEYEWTTKKEINQGWSYLFVLKGTKPEGTKRCDRMTETKECPKKKGFIYFPHPSICLKFFPEPLEYTLAMLSCVSEGGFLVRIDNVLKQRTVIKYIKPVTHLLRKKRIWIQGEHRQDEWYFTDLEEAPMTYLPLAKPLKEFDGIDYKLALSMRDGLWHAVPEKTKLQYICQFNMN